RTAMQKHTKSSPLTLWYPGKPDSPSPWWKPYFDKTRIQFRDRCLFANVALPPDLHTVKEVDWASLDKLAASAKGKGGRKAAGKKAARKRVAKKKAVAKKAVKKKAVKKKTARKKKR